MTGSAVNISGTFKKDSRPSNGLEAIADALVKDELARHVVVGIVELHKVTKEPGEAARPTVRFVAIEPIEGDAEDLVRDLLNKARTARGLNVVPEGLFDMPADVREAQPGDDDGPHTERVRDEWLVKDGD